MTRGYAARTFPRLGVVVDDGYVYPARGSQPLGPLAGAHAEMTAPTRHRRAGAAAATTAIGLGAGLGVLGLAPLLSKKSKATAFVSLPSGNVIERSVDGNTAVREAQSEVARFNALASAATPPAEPAPRESYQQIRDRVLGRAAKPPAVRQVDDAGGLAYQCLAGHRHETWGEAEACPSE